MLTDAPIFGILAGGRVNSVFPPDGTRGVRSEECRANC